MNADDSGIREEHYQFLTRLNFYLAPWFGRFLRPHRDQAGETTSQVRVVHCVEPYSLPPGHGSLALALGPHPLRLAFAHKLEIDGNFPGDVERDAGERGGAHNGSTIARPGGGKKQGNED